MLEIPKNSLVSYHNSQRHGLRPSEEASYTKQNINNRILNHARSYETIMYLRY